MASDKQQVDRMEAHRVGLLEEGKVSYPSGSGRIAIFTMYDPAAVDEATQVENRLQTLDAEARRMRGYLRWRGKDTVYFPEATIDSFWEAMDDVRVSDMVVIGLAQLSKVHIAPWTRVDSPAKQYRVINFFDAISRTGARPTITHLKAGSFYQRTCGSMSTTPLNVPFAWGFMANRARIWAAPQRGLFPGLRDVRPQARLNNVAEHFRLSADELQGAMSYERTKEIFGRRESLVSRRYVVPKFVYPAYDRLRANDQIHRVHDGIRNNLIRATVHSQ